MVKMSHKRKDITIKENTKVYCEHPTCELPCKHMDNKREGYKKLMVNPWTRIDRDGNSTLNCDGFVGL